MEGKEEVKSEDKPKVTVILKKEEQLRTTVSKARVLKALEKTMGIATTACKAAEVSATQYNYWKREDKDFAKKVSEVMNLRLDFLENELLSRIQKKEPGSNTLIMYELNNRGRERGYGVERIDVTSGGNELLAPSWVLNKQKPKEED